jgi:hypothetical protein
VQKKDASLKGEKSATGRYVISVDMYSEHNHQNSTTIVTTILNLIHTDITASQVETVLGISNYLS